MRVFTLKQWLVAATCATGLLVGSSEAQAFGHRWAASCGSWGGSAGGWGGSAGSWGGSWGGSAGSAGSWGGGHQRVGLLHRIFHRHRAGHDSWGGSHGGHVAYSGSAGSWGGSHGGSYGGGSYGGSFGGGSYGGGSYGGAYGGAVIEGPAVIREGDMGPGGTTPPPPPTGGDAPPPPMTLRSGDSSALLTVSVPSDARVFVNDSPTTSTGEVRHYVSRGLSPGAAYTYRVRAEFSRDGETVSETKSVRLTAGGTASLAFSEPASDALVATNPVETKLTLHVPADAKVTLAGNATHQQGETRHFVTSHLSEGQTWSDYVVRVEVERDGEIVADEMVLSLTGGESRELVMDLDAVKIAAR